MRLTINLSDYHKSSLKLPISVSRILKRSFDLLESLEDYSACEDNIGQNIEELNEIIPLLDALFMAAKEAMLAEEAQNKFVEENNKIQQDYIKLLNKASGANNDSQ